MKKKDIRLYNMIFPVWLMFLLPTHLWLLILPANFLIDSLVLYLSARHQRLDNRFALWRQSILPIWGIGFLCDLAGALLTFFLYTVMNSASVLNLLLFPGTTLISIPGVIVAGVMIYAMNVSFSFRKSGLDEKAIQRLSLHLAIFTAPYAMLIPLYG